MANKQKCKKCVLQKKVRILLAKEDVEILIADLIGGAKAQDELSDESENQKDKDSYRLGAAYNRELARDLKQQLKKVGQ